jgi:hypothetical protein
MMQLRLLLRRKKLISLKIDSQTRKICTDLTVQVIALLNGHADEVSRPSSFRYYMAWSLGDAIITATCLLCAGEATTEPALTSSFKMASETLSLLSSHLPAAERIHGELAEIVRIVQSRLELAAFGNAEHALPAFPEDFDQLLQMTSTTFTPFESGMEQSTFGVSPSSDGQFYFNQSAAGGTWHDHGSFMSSIRLA